MGPPHTTETKRHHTLPFDMLRMPLLQKGCFPYICISLWMSRPGPRSALLCIHLQIRVQSGVIDIRTLPTTTTTTTLRTSYKYTLRYEVCTLYRSIHTSSVHLLSYVYVAMQGCQDPNWNKRHQYRGRSIPLSSVLDPWLHADFRPVLQGCGVELLHNASARGFNARYRCQEDLLLLLLSPTSHYFYRRCPMQSLGISWRTIS